MSDATVVHVTFPPKLIQSRQLSKEELEHANQEAAQNAQALLQEETGIARKRKSLNKKKGDDAPKGEQLQEPTQHKNPPSKMARNKKKKAKKNERKRLATVSVDEVVQDSGEAKEDIAAQEDQAVSENSGNSTPEESNSSQDDHANRNASDKEEEEQEETFANSNSSEGDIPPLAILRSMESRLIDDKKKQLTTEQQTIWDDLNNGVQVIDTHLRVFLAHSLGQGASSNVVLGFHQHRGFVAIKIITSNAKNNTIISRTIASEMRALRRGDDHHNVLRLLGHHEKGPRTFLVLELCMTCLWTFVLDPCWENHPLLEDKTGIVKQMCEGAKFLHSRGVLHRDLKPSNILINESGVIKIADFGNAKVIETCEPSLFSILSEQQEIGTRGWRAPEVISSKTQQQQQQRTPASDVFSVGLIAYFVFSEGQHPFGSTPDEQERNIVKSNNNNNNNNKPKKKQQPPLNLNLNDGVREHFVRCCLRSDPLARFQWLNLWSIPCFWGRKTVSRI
jgi:hypothetical protein